MNAEFERAPHSRIVHRVFFFFITSPPVDVDGGQKRVHRGKETEGRIVIAARVRALRDARATLRGVICERVKRYAAISVIP